MKIETKFNIGDRVRITSKDYPFSAKDGRVDSIWIDQDNRVGYILELNVETHSGTLSEKDLELSAP